MRVTRSVASLDDATQFVLANAIAITGGVGASVGSGVGSVRAHAIACRQLSIHEQDTRQKGPGVGIGVGAYDLRIGTRKKGNKAIDD